MDWNDPASRLALIERVGPTEYNRLFEEHRKASVIEVVNGHAIRPVSSRFGRILMVGDTGSGFTNIEQARKFAEKATPGKEAAKS